MVYLGNLPWKSTQGMTAWKFQCIFEFRCGRRGLGWISLAGRLPGLLRLLTLRLFFCAWQQPPMCEGSAETGQRPCLAMTPREKSFHSIGASSGTMTPCCCSHRERSSKLKLPTTSLATIWCNYHGDESMQQFQGDGERVVYKQRLSRAFNPSSQSWQSPWAAGRQVARRGLCERISAENFEG